MAERTGKHLAVDDRDRWHGLDQLEEGIARQAILARLGRRFMRIYGSKFFRHSEQAMGTVFKRLEAFTISSEIFPN